MLQNMELINAIIHAGFLTSWNIVDLLSVNGWVRERHPHDHLELLLADSITFCR